MDKRILKSIIVGIALGLIGEFIFRPLVEKPIDKKVDEIVK